MIAYYDSSLKIESDGIKWLASNIVAPKNIGEYLNAIKLHDEILTTNKYSENIEWVRARFLSVMPTKSTHRSYNSDSKYDIHLRVTVMIVAMKISITILLGANSINHIMSN